jgi:hypothetical protein
MIRMLGSIGLTKLMLLTMTLALALSTTGYATWPVGSHGVDYIRAIDAPDNG